MTRALLSVLLITACDRAADASTTPASAEERGSDPSTVDPPSARPPPATATATAYWPAGFFSADNAGLDRHTAEWFGGHLAAMGEPSFHDARASGVESYRFIHLPTWGHPVVVRVDARGDAITVTHRILSGQGGYAPGELTTDVTRPIGAAELEAIRASLDRAGYWELPRDAERGMDGEEWIIEAVRDGRHHLVDRWTPSPEGEHARFVAACEVLRGLVVESSPRR